MISSLGHIHSVKVGIFMYLKLIETTHVVVYRGWKGLWLKTSFSNLHTKGSSLNEVPFSGLRMEDSTDLAVLTEQQPSPVQKYCINYSIPILKFSWAGFAFFCRRYCKNLYMWPWYLSLVEDLRDASMMSVASSDNLLFSVRNLLSDRGANLPPKGVQCLWVLR